MNWQENATYDIEKLLTYAEKKNLTESVDRPYFRNLLLDVMKMESPAENIPAVDSTPDTATAILADLCNLAVEKGIIEDMQYARDLFSGRIMGCLTPSPRDVREAFFRSMESGDPKKATDTFYNMCRDCDYIKVDAIAQNIRYFSESPCGELEITINLSKPEKDPKEIAKLKNAPSVGYPKCMLCVENPGYAGRSNFPARQNHRIVPLTLAGQSWYMQYSPYAYYTEHCIVFNSIHKPMKIDRGTFERMFSFVDQLPHYFIGSNADLPIVGGSILNHDHFQGGCYHFPMDKADKAEEFTCPDEDITVSRLDWPMSVICLESRNAEILINTADRVLNAWRDYSDESLGILSESDGEKHNTITPILRQVDGKYKLMLVLRNNRTDDENPLGIFHPHAQLHHIKKENIGLIEVMGLFILPGRLKTELAKLAQVLTGQIGFDEAENDPACGKHMPWLREIAEKRGIISDLSEAESVLRSEVAVCCAQVLADAGVYKRNPEGDEGFRRFMKTLGFQSR